MKVSYKVIKKFLPYLDTPENVAKDLIMHTAEVEEIISQKNDFNNIVYWIIKTITPHPDADSLKICMVDVWESENIQIVCGWSNLELWQWVAVAKLWASVLWHWEWEPVVMKKTAIRWVESYWMICASDEVGLSWDYPAKDSKEIVDLSSLNVEAGVNLAEALWKDDSILEIDNKAINHRPDLFSYMWVMREIDVINSNSFSIEYKKEDFSNLDKLNVINEIPELVKRYSLLKINNVSNIETPDYIKQVIESAWIFSKWLLVDISNYSLYFYGQPTHCFDADKVDWDIIVRLSKEWESFIALDDKEYKLSDNDIVIADNSKILALGWIIWARDSAVSDSTKNILVEWATFDQAVLRKTGRNLWVRTDSLNVFEKDLLPEMAICGISLITSILKNEFNDSNIVSFWESYINKQLITIVPYDLWFISRLIGKNYEEKFVLNIFKNLGIEVKWDNLIIPFWRKDLNTKADIAEEIARIDGYDNIQTTVPRINLWSIKQTNTYKLKNDVRNFFSNKGWYDMYNYSFVSKTLMDKLNLDINDCIDLKNSLSEDATHMRNSLIPNLMLSLEKNIKDFSNLKLFEFEKAFLKDKENISEEYLLSWVMINNTNDITYYKVQNIISDLLDTLFVDNYKYLKPKISVKYSNSWRTAALVVRWQEVWIVWEIHPAISKRFDISNRVWFFEIHVDKIINSVYKTVKASDISNFQMNNFDLTFLVNKDIKWSDIFNTILWVDKNLIKKVELFDIFEDEEKIPWKRSISFKIFIQSEDGTLNDKVKWSLIESIINKVNKKWGELR